ncbi:META domain-containing protein [Puia dinghuensis]|uniref:DUF306 domain-containing protein n=1 Tax=Puia dinghuensis TaxID=1792502 RepID=A0A8J2UFT2_9BACT|nr:META domain-containing protein [Puia dinghuensis]GGB11154.1 hypothetical protein GCM10011511_38420 [Puia dinghuensis]
MKVIAAICLASLGACQSPAGGPASHTSHKGDSVLPSAQVKVKAAPDTTTLAGSWYLLAVLPSDTATGKIPTLQLNPAKARFSGNTGCNTMYGQFWYSNTDSSMSFNDRITMTKMACPGYNEPAFLQSLKSVGHYRLHSGTLTLLSDGGTELSHWTRKPAVAPKAIKV